jgi:hypothetical protein
VNGIAHIKAAMDMTGLYGSPPRLPLFDVSPAERNDIARAIAESGFFDRNEDGRTWTEKSRIPEFEFSTS